MSRPIIQIRNLSKVYQLGAIGATSLKDEVQRLWARIRNDGERLHQRDFWALRDVNFEVRRGEVVGIIGRNGAGKSTLLKILSRITEPTSGEVTLRGRVASLLEVGTGFHPDLSGRENIFLNGAILGMSKAEIQGKLDEIIAFAEVEQFIDTPVKRYSSGMYVRLAFAVAAHLEPEILIVDEVLAVGDAQFQNKCLAKMGEAANKHGRTVLFVSHQMAAVGNLCKSCILLKNGQVAFQGPTESAIELYLKPASVSGVSNELDSHRPPWARPFIKSARVLNLKKEEQGHFALGSGLCIEMTFETEKADKMRRPVMGIVIKHAVLGAAAAVNMRMTGYRTDERESAAGVLRCCLPRLNLVQGHYSVDLWLGEGSTDVDMLAEYLKFTIEEADVYGTGLTPFANMGMVYLEPVWEFVSK